MIVRLVTTVATLMLLTAGALPAEPVPTKSWASSSPARPRDNPATSQSATAPAPTGGVSILVLPPRIATRDSRLPAAELLCDALAEAMVKDAGVKVVNRRQIARVLNEHKASLVDGERTTTAYSSLVAYDMMARLTFDTVRPLPRVQLDLIDLSTGNVLEAAEYDWNAQPDAAQAAQMARLAAQAASKVEHKADPKPFKIRFLGVANTSDTPRTEPFGQEAGQMLERTIASVPKVRMVHHLEAASAGEESLLILMGLSRLPGGRQFAPAADATVEASIREVDPQGKEFRQTPLEVKFRATVAGRPHGEWKVVTGTVDDWPAVTAKLCAEAAREVTLMVPQRLGADPHAAVRVTDDMARRRAQGRAELAASLKATYTGTPQERWKSLLDKVAAAMKLDPTYEEAAYAYAMLSNGMNPDGRGFVPGLSPMGVNHMTALAEGMKYLDRFKGSAEHRRMVLHITFPRVNWAIGAKRVKEILDNPQTVTAEELRMLDALKQHTDIAMRDFPPASCGMTTIPLICIGMQRAGVSDSQRWAYVQWVLKRCDEGPAINFIGNPAPKRYLWTNCSGALRLAIMEKQSDRAAAMLDKLLATAPRNEMGFQKYTMPQISARILASNDERLIAKLGPSTTARRTRPAWSGDFLGLEPPKISVFDAAKRLEAPKVTPLPVSYKPADPNDKPGFVPLLCTESRLYVLVFDLTPRAQALSGLGNLMHMHNTTLGEQHLAFVELASAGQARGELQLLEMPKLDKKLDITMAAQMGGKVYFGTLSCGILELTESSGQWRTIGLADGLPVKQVRSLLQLDDKTLLGNGGGNHSFNNFTLFTLDTEGQFKLLRAGTLPKDRIYGGGSLAGAWRHAGKIMAFEHAGIWTDLGGPAEKFTNNNSQNVGAARMIAERYWVWGYHGLVAWDDAGKAVRSWRTHESNFGSYSGGGWSNLLLCGIWLLGDFPELAEDRYEAMSNDESCLFLYRDGRVPLGRYEAMLCFEPASDTWYGPLNLAKPPRKVVGAKDGLWIGDESGLSYMETADFKAAAVATGRVITSSGLKKRQEELYAALPPLELAKFHLARNDLGKVLALLEPILKERPDDPEAILVMGFAKEVLARKPIEALEWYGKLAAMKDNRPARLTGLVATMSVMSHLKQYEDVVRISREIKQEFPTINFGYQGKNYAFRDTLEDAELKLARPQPTKKTPASRPASSPASQPAVLPGR